MSNHCPFCVYPVDKCCLQCHEWMHYILQGLDLKINNTALRMAMHPKVLGLTLDPKLTYSTHIHNISVQAHKPLQMIKTLTATEWGKQKETLMATYKAVMRPALEYASGRLLHPRPALTHCKSCRIQH